MASPSPDKDSRSRPPAAGVLDLLAHAGRAHARPELRIPSVRVGGRTVAVHQQTLLALPFCTLRRFAPAATPSGSVVLIVAPLSGHFAGLLRDTVAALLPDHTVLLTDWVDAAAVPLSLGRFDLDEMIAYVARFLRPLGTRVHLLGMSQSGLPILAVAALLAAENDPARPRSITLMGGLIDTRIKPTAMNRMARRLFADPSSARAAEAALVRPVDPSWPGAGRSVYPAVAQLAGIALYLGRRLSPQAPTPLDVFQRALIGDGAEPASRRALYDVFLTLMDLPAELYLQTMRVLFAEDALPRGTLVWRDQPIKPGALRDVALITVEAGRDDISGTGQTLAAHALCPNVPDRLRLHHVEPDIGHLGMFHGRVWRRRILPRLRAFLRAL